MYARVTRWEGGEAERMRRNAKEMSDNTAAGPPPGVPAKGFTMLFDPEAGTALAIALFETEEDLRIGDAALNAMTRDSDSPERRVSVETFQVGVDVRL